MRQFKFILVAMFMAVALSGCQSARYVMRDQQQGIVAIPSNSNSWPTYHRKGAEKLMTSHFPEGYVIEREEEAVIGQTTNYSENNNGSLIPVGKKPTIGIGVGSSSGTATTVNATEYRLHYRRK